MRFPPGIPSQFHRRSSGRRRSRRLMTDGIVVRKHRGRRVVLTTVGVLAGVLVLALEACWRWGGSWFLPRIFNRGVPATTSSSAILGCRLSPTPSCPERTQHAAVDRTARPDRPERALPLYRPDSAHRPPSIPWRGRRWSHRAPSWPTSRWRPEHLGYSASFTLFPDGTYNEADLKTSMSQLPVAKVTLAKDSSATTADYASLVPVRHEPRPLHRRTTHHDTRPAR